MPTSTISHKWTLGFVSGSPQGERYRQLAEKISETLSFMSAIGITPDRHPEIRQVDVFTSHEALLLNFEQADDARRFDLRRLVRYLGHMVWIGERTRQLDGAHVNYMKGIKNPIGVKCGPTLEPDDLLRLIDALNPEAIPGRLTLIGRFGSDKIAERLPRLMKATHKHGSPVVWSIDPMARQMSSRRPTATRPGRSTASSPKCAPLSISRASEDVHPGGMHLEMTGQNVTECTGGAFALTEDELSHRYHTHCDPRLNADQALELSFLVAERLHILKDKASKAA
ncbi:MAG: 3-deoxy-7-phosphoheptulonate synthase [Asticcacaulis sp.]